MVGILLRKPHGIVGTRFLGGGGQGMQRLGHRVLVDLERHSFDKVCSLRAWSSYMPCRIATCWSNATQTISVWCPLRVWVHCPVVASHNFASIASRLIGHQVYLGGAILWYREREGATGNWILVALATKSFPNQLRGPIMYLYLLIAFGRDLIFLCELIIFNAKMIIWNNKPSSQVKVLSPTLLLESTVCKLGAL